VRADDKIPTHELEDIPFPLCHKQCALAHALGVGECEANCPDKFDEDGEPIRKDRTGEK